MNDNEILRSKDRLLHFSLKTKMDHFQTALQRLWVLGPCSYRHSSFLPSPPLNHVLRCHFSSLGIATQPLAWTVCSNAWQPFLGKKVFLVPNINLPWCIWGHFILSHHLILEQCSPCYNFSSPSRMENLHKLTQIVRSCVDFFAKFNPFYSN